ncbi:hypothetical protein Tco_0528288 [Tanacetum coccineum]
MENSKSRSIPMQEKLKLCKSHSASTPAEVKCMQNIPYPLSMGSIMVSCYTDDGYLTDVDDPHGVKAFPFPKHSEHTKNIGISYFGFFQGASTPAEVKCMQNIPYPLSMGSIMYAMRYTLLDVAFTQNITSLFQQNPGDLHWTVVKNILKYLHNTKDMFLVYGGDVDGKSAKQSIFTTSSAEAEYIDALDASKKAVWVRKFISGLGVVTIIEEPVKLYCDNTGAFTIAIESGITKGSRHYRAKVHYLREVIDFGDTKLEKVHTNDNLNDPFTKALPFPKHSEHTKNIGMLPANSLL